MTDRFQAPEYIGCRGCGVVVRVGESHTCDDEMKEIYERYGHRPQDEFYSGCPQEGQPIVEPENIFKKSGRELGILVAKKNEAYGDSITKSAQILERFFPRGVEPKNYRDMLLIVRVLDKLSRIATSKSAFGEDPWQDIAGYGILGMTAKK